MIDKTNVSCKCTLSFAACAVLAAFPFFAEIANAVVQEHGIEASDCAVISKAEQHKRLTGETTVGYQGVRRTETIFSAKAASTSPAKSESSLLSNVTGEQLSDRTVRICYLLDSEYQCNVSCAISVDGQNLQGTLTFADTSAVGIVSGSGRHEIIWQAETDWPNRYSDKVKAVVSATETDIPKSWAHITIAWAQWGGRDVDVCGYWVGQPSVKVGYSHGSGSTSAAYRSAWKGDNTGSGPEYILVGVSPDEILSGVTTRQYKIHFNHYGTAAADPHVRVTVTCNGQTLQTTCSVATRRGNAASTSDPYVLISFDESGTPVSISTGN